jgi:hypothetical protein
MATSSITKTFVIRSKAALKRFQTEMKKPSLSSMESTETGSKLEEGKSLLKQYYSR